MTTKPWHTDRKYEGMSETSARCSYEAWLAEGGERRRAWRRNGDAWHLFVPPTPEATIASIIAAVRDRGIGALREPQIVSGLKGCDAAARRKINDQIDRLLASGHEARLEGGRVS